MKFFGASRRSRCGALNFGPASQALLIAVVKGGLNGTAGRMRAIYYLRRSPERFLAVALSGSCGLGCSLKPMRIRVFAEFMPVGLGKVHAVILRGLFNVGKC